MPDQWRSSQLGCIARSPSGDLSESAGSRCGNRWFLRMPHALVTMVGIEKPSEAVADRMAVHFRSGGGRVHRRERRLHFRCAEERVMLAGPRPSGRDRLAMCRPRHPPMWPRSNSDRFRGTYCLPGCGHRRGSPPGSFPFRRRGVRHFQRDEYAFVQKLREALAQHFLDDHGQNTVSGVAVLPLRARRKLGGAGLLHQREYARIVNLGNLIVRGRRGRGRPRNTCAVLGRVAVLLCHQVFVVEQAGGVVQDRAA